MDGGLGVWAPRTDARVSAYAMAGWITAPGTVQGVGPYSAPSLRPYRAPSYRCARYLAQLRLLGMPIRRVALLLREGLPDL